MPTSEKEEMDRAAPAQRPTLPRWSPGGPSGQSIAKDQPVVVSAGASGKRLRSTIPSATRDYSTTVTTRRPPPSPGLSAAQNARQEVEMQSSEKETMPIVGALPLPFR